MAVFSRYYQLRLMRVYGVENIYKLPEYLSRQETQVVLRDHDAPAQVDHHHRVDIPVHAVNG